jgi:hypothetical protein
MTGPAAVPCAEHEIAISLHAAGALDAEEAARLEAHVQGCAACRAVLDASVRALGLARLPPVSEPERRALAGLPASLVSELRERSRRRALGARVAVIAGVAAALVLAVASPALLRKSPGRLALDEERAWQTHIERRLREEQRASWNEPDLDALWEASDVFDLEPSRGRATFVDAALSSYDAGVGY